MKRRLGRALLMLLVVVLGSASAATGWFALGRRVAVSVGSDTSQPWTIVLQQADGNLTLATTTGQTLPFTKDADGRALVYLYPTPAPDGQRIAMVAVRHGSANSAALEVHDLSGNRTTLYDQPGSSPFYLSWSPNSRRLAFLTGTNTGMTLHAAEADGQTEAVRIAPGQPSYFAWSPDSERLLLHIGGGAPLGSLQLYEWGANAPQRLTAAPAQFQAPGWHPDGEQALVVIQNAAGAALATIDPGGTVVRELAQVARNTVFVPSPDAQQVAYLVITPAAVGELHVLNTATSTDQTVSSGSVVTMFWSPTGDALAFLTVAGSDNTQTIAYTRQQATPRLQWNVFNVGDGSVKRLAVFEPSREFINLLPFFDQYAQSHRLWNRAGSHLLYASPEGVFTVDVMSGEQQRVGPGVLGVWMDQ